MALDRRGEVADFLRRLDLGGAECTAPVETEEGRPFEALKAAVDRLAPDLVALGTRGQGALGRLVLGSTAQEALRNLACDVLAVPPPSAE